MCHCWFHFIAINKAETVMAYSVYLILVLFLEMKRISRNRKKNFLYFDDIFLLLCIKFLICSVVCAGMVKGEINLKTYNDGICGVLLRALETNLSP